MKKNTDKRKRNGVMLVLVTLLVALTIMAGGCGSTADNGESSGTANGAAKGSSPTGTAISIYEEDYLEACSLISEKYIYLEEKLGKSREQFLQERHQYSRTVDWAGGKSVFVDEIRKLRALFPDGHFSWSLDSSSRLRNGFHSLGFAATIGAEGDVLVGKVYPYFGIGLKEGDELLTWNGKPVEEELQAIGSLIPQSSQEGTRERAARYLALDYPMEPLRDRLEPVLLTVRDGSGTIREMKLEWKAAGATTDMEEARQEAESGMILLTRGLLPSLEELPKAAKISENGLVYYFGDSPEGRYAVLHPRSFSGWSIEELDTVLGAIMKKAPKLLVVDLKDSAGGYFDQVLFLSRALGIEKPLVCEREEMVPGESRLKTAEHFDGIEREIRLKNVWKGKVIFRINPVTVSGGDYFSRWMKLNERGIFFGAATAGAGAGTDEFMLKNTKTEISIPLRERKIEGDAERIEGHPTLPDVVFYGTIEDYLH